MTDKDTGRDPATNYYKAYAPRGAGKERAELLEFFSGEGAPAALAYAEIVARATSAGIGSAWISVFRFVNGVPPGIPEVVPLPGALAQIPSYLAAYEGAR